MAEVTVTPRVSVTLDLSDSEVEELGDQLSFLINDNRGTELTRQILANLSLKGGY